MPLNKNWTAVEKLMFSFLGTYLGRSYSSLYSYWRSEDAICSLFDKELLIFLFIRHGLDYRFISTAKKRL